MNFHAKNLDNQSRCLAIIFRHIDLNDAELLTMPRRTTLNSHMHYIYHYMKKMTRMETNNILHSINNNKYGTNFKLLSKTGGVCLLYNNYNNRLCLQS